MIFIDKESTLFYEFHNLNTFLTYHQQTFGVGCGYYQKQIVNSISFYDNHVFLAPPLFRPCRFQGNFSDQRLEPSERQTWRIQGTDHRN